MAEAPKPFDRKAAVRKLREDLERRLTARRYLRGRNAPDATKVFAKVRRGSEN